MHLSTHFSSTYSCVSASEIQKELAAERKQKTLSKDLTTFTVYSIALTNVLKIYNNKKFLLI